MQYDKNKLSQMQGEEFLRLLEGSSIKTTNREQRYAFNCALQTGTKTRTSANRNYNHAPTAKEAIAVLEELRQKGKDVEVLPRKAHDDFDIAVDKVIKWLEDRSGLGYKPSGGYDISEARAQFNYKGTLYRVDIKACGSTNEAWFL